MTKKKTNEEFITQLKEINPEIIPKEPYNGSKTKILCECGKCGNSWYVSPNQLLIGHGCPYCSGKRKKTNEEFLSQLKEINNQITPLDPYINFHTKIQCECNKCGYIWYVTPNGLLRGDGCPSCYGNVKKTNSEFLKELSIIHPNCEPLEEYKGGKKPILIRCKSCGNEWRARPNGLLRGHGCPICSKKKMGEKATKTNDDFIAELSLINPNILPLDSYTKSSVKIRCQCKICGYEWSASPNNLLYRKTRCPCCCHAQTSIVEQIMIGAFSLVLGEESVCSRDRKTIGKELDIMIPSLSLAIEFGAWYWHKNRLATDNEKQRLCKENGIHLISILEDCPKVISKELVGDFRLHEAPLSNDKNYSAIKDLIKEICSEYSIPFDSIDINWDSIVANAHNKAQKRSNEEFLEQLHKANPNVILLDQYTTSYNRVHCKCMVCGTEWNPVANSLLQGHACPKCGRSRTGLKNRLTNAEFINRLSEINPNVVPLEPYEIGTKKISFRCKVCGKTWKAMPQALLAGTRCPKCGRSNPYRPPGKPIKCVETGICYESVHDAKRKTGINNILSCVKGRQKTACGYHWEYITNQKKEP